VLFNSYEFLLLFLPVTLIVYFRIARRGHEAAISWLVLASLFFYGWWNPVYLVLLLGSMVGNYGLGRILSSPKLFAGSVRARIWLTVGVIGNLALLGYFKYANFAVDTVNTLAGTDWHLEQIILPLATSFFTFQQIAYLVDAYRKITKEYRFLHYALFVTFFPQLIAGPIVHHKDMLPQFMRAEQLRPQAMNIAIGLTIFFLGLFKKTVLADGIAVYSTPVFNAAEAGQTLTFFEAWGGALAYTFQLYFDFSGYSDMAIGAARLFGIKLPLNFHSPYKATSIIEFWRRWHITLSTFLRDYLYIPLGGNRRGAVARYRNLMLTMLLGGLWHGAGWTFVVWGGLHGLYLAMNHFWHFLGRRYWPDRQPTPWGKTLAWCITFVAVVVGWVFFRATSFDGAMTMLQGMAGLNGFALPNAIAARLGTLWDVLQSMGFQTYLGGGAQFMWTWLWVSGLLAIALLMPNTQQLLGRFEPALKLLETHRRHEIQPLAWLIRHLCWQPTGRWAVAIGLLAGCALLAMTSVSEFLYFQF
jgi:D-alanyl-lipoteichoic acid acyltransferase DltB (MBOAT superfamily)